jgi:predicted site-specific integrase-resolvase
MEKLLSRKEAAELLGVSPATLAVWQSTGRYAFAMRQMRILGQIQGQ